MIINTATIDNNTNNSTYNDNNNYNDEINAVIMIS